MKVIEVTLKNLCWWCPGSLVGYWTPPDCDPLAIVACHSGIRRWFYVPTVSKITRAWLRFSKSPSADSVKVADTGKGRVQVESGDKTGRHASYYGLRCLIAKYGPYVSFQYEEKE